MTTLDVEPATSGSKQASTQFKPGQSGNPEGRPKGSRNKLGEAFLNDLLAVWETDGQGALKRVARDRPQDFLRVVASVVPRLLSVKYEGGDKQSATDWTREELIAFLNDEARSK
jgi:hypothetical protein